jgi:outer membrane protein OmpA-like peptidoglycan-associated protein
VSGTKAEEAELAVLSLARAASVRGMLVKLGLAPSRITTAGKGGTEPVVPHADKLNNWKNRRVEFVLSQE